MELYDRAADHRQTFWPSATDAVDRRSHMILHALQPISPSILLRCSPCDSRSLDFSFFKLPKIAKKNPKRSSLSTQLSNYVTEPSAESTPIITIISTISIIVSNHPIAQPSQSTHNHLNQRTTIAIITVIIYLSIYLSSFTSLHLPLNTLIWSTWTTNLDLNSPGP